ncbi:MAG: pilus assembly protein PilP [Gammaproteobacteria bacterium]|nr:pilus assembly protein PilP [Gammaproteobacteria bacterium]MDP6673359.1 pilus assembly protein PilP [Gammaproteobacteria bacterium]
MRLLVRLPAVLLVLVLTACGGGMGDLEQYIADVKQRPGGRIEPLPQIKPYETFDYQASNKRSPFVRDRSADENGVMKGPTPIKNRNKEYLEQFPLDTLNMVGTLEREGKIYGLVQTNDGLVHRILPGNYVGQNDGRVISIMDGKIEIEELVSNGIGNFFKRSAGIGID